MKFLLPKKTPAVSAASGRVQSELSSMIDPDESLLFHYQSTDVAVRQLKDEQEIINQLITQRSDEAVQQNAHLPVGGL